MLQDKVFLYKKILNGNYGYKNALKCEINKINSLNKMVGHAIFNQARTN